MDEKKCLVVYYSRTGTTRKVAEAIAAMLGCDIEEVVDTKKRSGFFGYLRCLKDALLKRPAKLEPAKNDTADYDLVIIGTPVWAWSVSCPVRAYLSQCGGRLPDVAFFCTTGGTGRKRTFRHMSELTGKAPRATLGLKMKDVLKRPLMEQLEEFVEQLRR